MDLESIASNISKSKNGIYFSKNKSQISYPDEGNENCLDIEQDSFWFKHRNKVISSLIKKFSHNQLFYDIGGGNGYVSKHLQNEGIETVLIEPGEKGAQNAKQRGIEHVVCSTLHDAGFGKESIDNAGIFDVVEHIEDDVSFILEIFTALKPNGKLFITVPAHTFLWSAHDNYSGHYRRYNLKSINRLLKNTGFEIKFISYFFSILPLPIFIFRSIPYRLGIRKENKHKKHKSEHKKKNGILNFIWKLELNRIETLKGIPFGGSLIIVAQKSK